MLIPTFWTTTDVPLAHASESAQEKVATWCAHSLRAAGADVSEAEAGELSFSMPAMSWFDSSYRSGLRALLAGDVTVTVLGKSATIHCRGTLNPVPLLLLAAVAWLFHDLASHDVRWRLITWAGGVPFGLFWYGLAWLEFRGLVSGMAADLAKAEYADMTGAT